VRKDDTRSDIYFLGCIFYNMLTGEPPLSETRDRLQRLSKSRFLSVTPIRKAEPSIPDSVALAVNKSMMLDPNRRYQSPGAMLSDLQIASKRLAEDPQATAVAATDGADGQAPESSPAEKQRSVMVVESNVEMQDVFRRGFKRVGYRVLLTSDPDRAMERMQQDVHVADCVIFNAQKIGKPALHAFNSFGENAKTSLVPAVLLLDREQLSWRNSAVTAEHRVVLPLPITIKKLRRVLDKLIVSSNGTEG